MKTENPPTVVWFRDDLRTTDHDPLSWAAHRGPIVGLVIEEDPAHTGARALGRPHGGGGDAASPLWPHVWQNAGFR